MSSPKSPIMQDQLYVISSSQLTTYGLPNIWDDNSKAARGSSRRRLILIGSLIEFTNDDILWLIVLSVYFLHRKEMNELRNFCSFPRFVWSVSNATNAIGSRAGGGNYIKTKPPPTRPIRLLKKCTKNGRAPFLAAVVFRILFALFSNSKKTPKHMNELNWVCFIMKMN